MRKPVLRENSIHRNPANVLYQNYTLHLHIRVLLSKLIPQVYSDLPLKCRYKSQVEHVCFMCHETLEKEKPRKKNSQYEVEVSEADNEGHRRKRDSLTGGTGTHMSQALLG